jgi:hypothetical protein
MKKYRATLTDRTGSAVFSLDTGMRLVSNSSSAEPGMAPDNEVNTHLGNPR